MAIKVIVWGTGSVGRLALREILRNDLFELVGVKVYHGHRDQGCRRPADRRGGLRVLLPDGVRL
jgi:hypothetical protein